MMSTMTYTTAQEIAFLNGLSLPTLKSYLVAADRRTDWESIDAEEVLTHCRKRIASIEERAGRH